MTQEQAVTPAPAPVAPGVVLLSQASPERRGVWLSPPALVALVAAMVVLGVGIVAIGTRHTDSHSVGASTASDQQATPRSDADVASALLWTRADFPATWSQVEHQTTAAGQAAGQHLSDCSGLTQPSVPPVHASAPNFANGDHVATMSVDIEPDAAVASTDFTKVSDGTFLACLRAQIVAELGGEQACACAGIDVNAVPIAAPQGTASTSSYAFRLTVTRAGSIAVVLDGYLFAQGRVEVTMIFRAAGNYFPTEIEKPAVDGLVQRLAVNHAS